VLSGAAGEFFAPGGQRDVDESFLVMMNAGDEDLAFHIPRLAAPMSWEALVDTSQPTGFAATPGPYAPDEIYCLNAKCFALFINRAPRNGMVATALETQAEAAPPVSETLDPNPAQSLDHAEDDNAPAV
jgi:hypothetical protein